MTKNRKLFIQQTRWWSGFAYDVLDVHRKPIGNLRWPEQPRGFDNSDFKLDLRRTPFSISWEPLNYKMAQDLRYQLSQNQTVLSTVDVRYHKGVRRPILHLTRDPEIQVHHARSGFRVLLDEKEVGSITQPGFITLKRELAVDVPDWLDETDAVFLGVVALAVML